MPPEKDISGNVIVYLVVDGEKKEISPVPVWYSSKSITTSIKSKLPKLQPIEAVCKILWKRFQNNKKARLRKQQIIKSLPKGHGKYYLRWLEAKKTDGAVQMPFSWMAYWYRRLDNAVN